MNLRSPGQPEAGSTAPAAGQNELLTILNGTPFLLTRCTADLKFANVSNAYAARLGRRPEDLEGRPIVDFIGREALETLMPYIRKVLQGERVEYETVVNYLGAGPRRVQFTYVPDRDANGNVRGWIASLSDVTEKREAEARVAADYAAMILLREAGEHCLNPRITFDECLQKILSVAITITRADKGIIQLFDVATARLRIAAQQGFAAPSVSFFANASDKGSACGAPLQQPRRVIVDDVLTSDSFLGKLSKRALLDEKVRAVTSTPLVGGEGTVLGLISVHFHEQRHPSTWELHFLDLLLRQAADYLERKRAQETEQLLVREVQHRSNNLLALVQAIAGKTLSNKTTRDAFEGRLLALARANRQITKTASGSLTVRDLVALHLRPFPSRVLIGGPEVSLGPKQAQDLSLLFHELSTNAVKYGALSNKAGNVEVAWNLIANNGNRILKLRWHEQDGPAVKEPLQKGFGSLLIQSIFQNAQLDYEPTGFRCEVEMPLVKVGRVWTEPPGSNGSE
jgi:PAS domain S-box-containing protein